MSTPTGPAQYDPSDLLAKAMQAIRVLKQKEAELSEQTARLEKERQAEARATEKLVIAAEKEKERFMTEISTLTREKEELLATVTALTELANKQEAELESARKLAAEGAKITTREGTPVRGK